jgi:hypothetical protein
MKHTGSAKKKSRSNGSSTKKRPQAASQYVVCVKNEEYPASLELRKLYPTVPDKPAERAGLIRVIDESGEDYLYPSDYFVPIKLPRTVQKAVQLAS